jgi:hypothetical protein
MQFGIFTVGDVTTDPTTGRRVFCSVRCANQVNVARHRLRQRQALPAHPQLRAAQRSSSL